MDNLDKEELELLSSVEAGEWESVKDAKPEVDRLVKFADATIRKKKRINIRISETDLSQIRIKAIEEGLPYQTLISSVLHKYAKGQLS